MIRNTLRSRFWHDEQGGGRRYGSFMTLGLFCLMACMTFVAFSVDVGMLSLTQTRMQSAVDSAALAAAMEITYAIENAGDDVQDVVLYAKGKAQDKAVEVAGLNGVYVDKNVDVTFGHRIYDSGTQQFHIQWGIDPPNVVKVVARRDNADVSQPDGQMQMLFAGVGGSKYASIRTAAVAYVESRDIVTVLDFSRSMNFDSYFASEYNSGIYLPQADLEANMHTIWTDLGSPTYGNMPWTPDWVTVPTTDNKITAKWRDTAIDLNISAADFASTSGRIVELRFNPSNTTQTFSLLSGTNAYAGTGSNSGKTINRVRVRTVSGSSYQYTIDFYNDADIIRGLGLTNVTYPYPVGSWAAMVQMCRDTSTSGTYYQAKIDTYGYRRKFGLMLWIQYIMRFASGHQETPDIWKTRHYPFSAMTKGETLFADFLQSLNFSDHLGMVSYDSSHRVEQVLNESGMPSVNISSAPLTDNYQAIRDMITHKQAAHYSYATNMGGGLKDAKWLLDNYKRVGARPTILLMTDGNTNTMDSGASSTLPADWDWNKLFDYNNDGAADYTTTSSQFKYALLQAKAAVDAGITIHTMSVGVDANQSLMQAIAHLGGGIYINVPGGTSSAQMQAQTAAAFQQIAAMVPPAKLLNPAE